jgi:hypothetical protein
MSRRSRLHGRRANPADYPRVIVLANLTFNFLAGDRGRGGGLLRQPLLNSIHRRLDRRRLNLNERSSKRQSRRLKLAAS